MTRVAFVDAAAGCAGDMFLGALVDAGLPISVLEDVVRRLDLADVSIKATLKQTAGTGRAFPWKLLSLD